MYDTIKMIVSRESLGRVDPISMIGNRLQGGTESVNRESGEVWASSKMKNMIVSANGEGLMIKGSLCKFKHGNNLQTLSRVATHETLIEISETIGVNIEKAKIMRLDFATNIESQHTPNVYFHALGQAPGKLRMTRSEVGGSTLRYQSKRKVWLFYDKIAEWRASGMPDIFRGKMNLLRFEIRYIKDVGRQLKCHPLTAKQLYDPIFFATMIQKWIHAYKTIHKIREPMIDFSKTLGVKDLEKQLLLAGIENLGGMQKVVQHIDIQKKMGAFQNRNQSRRLRKKLEGLEQISPAKFDCDLIEELDSKFQVAASKAKEKARQ